MKYLAGTRVTGKINNVTDLGVFVSLPGHRHGLIHHSDFAGDWERQKQLLQPHQQVRVVVLHNHHGQLALSLARVHDDQLKDPTNQFNDLQPADFARVLRQTAQKAAQEISFLQQEEKKY